MKEKCEICGGKKNLKEIGFKPSSCMWNYYTPVTVCEDCYKKIRKANEEPRRNEGKSMKAEHAMQVTYNGLTGELVKLEKTPCTAKLIDGVGCSIKMTYDGFYDLTLYDSEKQATVSFTGVKLKDVKFLGGEVSFG